MTTTKVLEFFLIFYFKKVFINFCLLQFNGQMKAAVNGPVSSSSSSSSGYDQEDFTNHPPSLACLNQNLQPVPHPIKANPAAQINDDKLIELMERTGYNIVQKNGQRIFGGPPPNWTGPPPCKGTEIFVGKVPRNMFEWELVPIFQQVSWRWISQL